MIFFYSYDEYIFGRNVVHKFLEMELFQFPFLIFSKSHSEWNGICWTRSIRQFETWANVKFIDELNIADILSTHLFILY